MGTIIMVCCIYNIFTLIFLLLRLLHTCRMKGALLPGGAPELTERSLKYQKKCLFIGNFIFSTNILHSNMSKPQAVNSMSIFIHIHI